MLVSLRIQNLALIKDVQLQFAPEMNVLSGESGTGKSMLVKALALLQGQKADFLEGAAASGSGTGAFTRARASGTSASRGTASTGKKGKSGEVEGRTLIEACWHISSRGPAATLLKERDLEGEENQLLVRRVFSPEGKSRTYINGSLMPLSFLRELMLHTGGEGKPPLMEITQQGKSFELLSTSSHLQLLDRFCRLEEAVLSYKKSYEEWNRTAKALARKEEEGSKQKVELEFLKYQQKEIENFNPQEGEEEILPRQILYLKNSKERGNFFQQLFLDLYEKDFSLLEILQQHRQKGEAILGESVHEKEQVLLKTLEQITVQVEDLAQELRGHQEAHDNLVNGELFLEVEDLEQRWYRLRELQKKYGSTSKEILETLQKIRDKTSQIIHYDSDLQKLRERERVLYDEAQAKAKELHLKREKGLELFCAQIRKKLTHLNMKGFHFLARINTTEKLHPRGFNAVEFLYQTSPRGACHPIAKCASGGELSRLLLALKSSVHVSPSSPSSPSAVSSEENTTCVFDEVDTGVSGLTAQRVGKNLSKLSQHQQLLVITHLPQVASYADRHFLFQKELQGETFCITCRALSEEERVLELARLISGENLSATSLKHAKQLLKEAFPS